MLVVVYMDSAQGLTRSIVVSGLFVLKPSWDPHQPCKVAKTLGIVYRHRRATADVVLVHCGRVGALEALKG